MTYRGRIKDGVVVLDEQVRLAEGTIVRVEPIEEKPPQTGGEAGRTVGRTARAAAVGGLIGGSSGARTGARVGLGASILTSGASVNIPRGTIVETSLTAALTLPVG